MILNSLNIKLTIITKFTELYSSIPRYTVYEISDRWLR